MDIRLVDKSNFHRGSLKSFQRFQIVDKVYRLTDSELVLVDNPFTEDWDSARKIEKEDEILSGNYIVYCAFDGEQVVGEIMLQQELNKGRLVIDSFHVSMDCRRQGIGRALFDAAKQEAIKRSAHALYASCCSAEETILFYLAMGFSPSSDPIPSCVAMEPCDIQMECPI